MKRFKKSEIAIYAIALMLVAAGYFNYSTFEQKTEETYSEDINQIEDKYANVGDAVLVSSNETQSENQVDNNSENEDTNINTNTSANTVDENVSQTNATESSNDYYANSKLDRDKMYAEMISNYEKIINNSNASEAQKSIATQEITKINDTKNAIMICENFIQTKGFDSCVILVNDGSVNVVVSVEGGLNTDKVAKIQNIVTREMKAEISNIHITEK